MHYLVVFVLGTTAVVVATYLINPEVVDYNIKQMAGMQRITGRETFVSRPGYRFSPAPERKPDTQMWGIVVSSTNVPVVSPSGEFLQMLPPGSTVDVVAVSTNTNDMITCRINIAGETTNVLLPASVVTVRQGRASVATEEQKFLITKIASLTAEINELKKQLEGAQDVRHLNPYTAEYESAKKSYEEFWKKVKELTAKRDSAIAGERMRYAEQLQRMRGQDVIVAQKYKTAKEKYDQWNALHDKVTPAKRRLEQLEKQLAQYQERLNDIESGR